jgi:hypothetical protein
VEKKGAQCNAIAGPHRKVSCPGTPNRSIVDFAAQLFKTTVPGFLIEAFCTHFPARAGGLAWRLDRGALPDEGGQSAQGILAVFLLASRRLCLDDKDPGVADSAILEAQQPSFHLVIQGA